MTDRIAGREIRLRLVEAFAALNLACLSFDIWLAHSANSFAHPAEWIPVPFGVVSLAVLPGIWSGPSRERARWLGFGVGLLAVGVGLVGTVFHLEAEYFEEQTLKSLVYTAPFAAPLSYVGVGLLLWLNRLEGDQPDWGRWVLLLAWGGCVGNFALSLLDHAQNGFFHLEEWLSVVVAALGVGFLIVAVFRPADLLLLRTCFLILLIQAATGILGTALHMMGNLKGPASTLWDHLIYGAPAFAPLLFTNISLLAGIGVWDMLTVNREDR